MVYFNHKKKEVIPMYSIDSSQQVPFSAKKISSK